MWIILACCIKDAAKDSVGMTRESSRTHSSHKESWWFGEEVQSKIAAKQARFRELLLCREGNQKDRAMAKERGIKLIGYTMKLWERVIERRLRSETMVSENQFGFMSGRSITEDMYEGAKTRVRSSVGNTKLFFVEVGLHQRSAISPYLFALILDELPQGIQKNIPWSMVFADDIVLVTESANGLSMRLESWRKALEDSGLRILQPNESFRYLGSVIHRSGKINDDVTHRIRTGWVRWRAASGVLCDKRVPLKLKGNFYRVAIRPTMLYGSECWPITKAHANMVEVAELRMLRWTCGKTMLDMIRNRVFRAEIEVESIIHKMREERLRWFGHVKRRPQTAPVRRVEALLVDGLRRKSRPKLRWEDRLKLDMKELLLSEDMTSDMNAWRDRITHFHLPEVFLEAVYLLSKLPESRGRICLHSTYVIPCSGGIGDEQKNQRTGSEPRLRLEPRRTEPEPEPPVPVPRNTWCGGMVKSHALGAMAEL
nr:hypothetical protein [Tanacetum cinerariifolium]